MDELLVKKITELVLQEMSDDKSENANGNSDKLLVPIAVSARHLHLTQEHIDVLFGAGYKLKVKKILMSDQFAAEECVTLVSGKLRSIENVRIIGPARKYSQVEISKTDAFKLGINAPLRESGKVSGSGAISIVGPVGTVHLDEGCIIAKRHVHFSPEDAVKFGIKDGDVVGIKIDTERGGVLGNVICRVSSEFRLEMHLDTDEANGLGIEGGCMGAMICL